MDKRPAAELHNSLGLAGFRALATAAGLLQLCRELEASGVLNRDAIGRIKQAVHDELMEQVPRSKLGDAAFARRLRERLDHLFAGSERLGENPVVSPD
jgi:hypothetical protein